MLSVIAENLFFYFVSAQSNIHYINWNTTNPLFREYGNNIIDINPGTEDQPWRYEQANIICPRYSSSFPTSRSERYIIYNVTRNEFEHCRVIDPQQNKIVAVCNSPYKLTFFTLTFRAFSPVPRAFEFHPGEDYYFISTSSKRNLYKHSGGRCASHNMRLMFRILDTNRGTNDSSIEQNLNSHTFRNPHLTNAGRLHELEITQNTDGEQIDYNENYSENKEYYSSDYEKPEAVQSNTAANSINLFCDPVISVTIFIFTYLAGILIS